jgi:hypothetical protein
MGLLESNLLGETLDFDRSMSTSEDFWALIVRLLQHYRELGETFVPWIAAVGGSANSAAGAMMFPSIIEFTSKLAAAVRGAVMYVKTLLCDTVAAALGNQPCNQHVRVAVRSYGHAAKHFMIEFVDCTYNYFVELFRIAAKVYQAGSAFANCAFASLAMLNAAALIVSEETVVASSARRESVQMFISSDETLEFWCRS